MRVHERERSVGREADGRRRGIHNKDSGEGRALLTRSEGTRHARVGLPPCAALLAVPSPASVLSRCPSAPPRPLSFWPGFPPRNPPTLSGFRRFVHRNGRCAGVLARAAGLRKQEVKRRPHGPKLTLALHASGLLSVVSQTPTSQVPLKLARERASIGSTRLHTQRSYMHVLYECIGASYAVYNDIYIKRLQLPKRRLLFAAGAGVTQRGR